MDWWWEHRPKAPGAVTDELDAAFDRLATDADVKPVIGARGIRRMYLRRIRYHLYFRIRDDDVVDVLSLWQANRGIEPDL